MTFSSVSAVQAAAFTTPTPHRKLLATGIMEYADEGQRQPLLALHGGMGGFDQSWILARALLADPAAYRILAVSRPGYLGTPLAAGQGFSIQADAYARLLDTLGIETTIVAAVSAGGPSALDFALRYPDRCRGLILVSAATGQLKSPPNMEKRLKVMNILARIPGFPALMRHKIERDPRASAARSVRDEALFAKLLSDPEAFALLMRFKTGMMHQLAARISGTRHDTKLLNTGLDIQLETLSVPTLVIHGDRDSVVPFQHAAQMIDRTSNVQLLTIQNGGHIALFTHLQEIRTVVVSFMERLRTM